MADIGSSYVTDLVKDSGSASALYSKAKSHGINEIEDLVKGLEYEAWKLSKTPRLEPVKILGHIPAVALRGPDHINAGYLKRTAEELMDVAARKSRNKRLMVGTGLASLLALGAAAAMSDKKEDKYLKEVEKLMQSHRLLSGK